VLDGAHRLDRHEGIALAGAPYPLAQASQGGVVTSRARKSPNEDDGVSPRQRFEGEGGHVDFSFQLGERPLDDGRVEQILRARRDHQEERPGVQSAADESEQPNAHLVRPVEVFEDQRGRLPFRDVRE
jgi:hypothetical protein